MVDLNQGRYWGGFPSEQCLMMCCFDAALHSVFIHVNDAHQKVYQYF